MKASEPGEESLQLLVPGAELKVETGAGEAEPSVKGGPPAHQASRMCPGRQVVALFLGCGTRGTERLSRWPEVTQPAQQQQRRVPKPGLPGINRWALPTTSHSEASQGRIGIFQGLCSISRKFSLKRKFQPHFFTFDSCGRGRPLAWWGIKSNRTETPGHGPGGIRVWWSPSLVSQALLIPTGRRTAQTPGLVSEIGSTTLVL